MGQATNTFSGQFRKRRHDWRRPAGEARQVLLAPAGGRASDPAAVRRHAAEDLGAARLAKKGHTAGAVSAERPERRDVSGWHSRPS